MRPFTPESEHRPTEVAAHEPVTLLLDALRTNATIAFFPDKIHPGSPLGDTFVRAWAIHTVLNHLCELRHLPADSPRIAFSNPSGDPHAFDFYQHFPSRYRLSDAAELRANRFTQRHLIEFAKHLALTLPESILNATPTPFHFEHPKFRTTTPDQGAHGDQTIIAREKLRIRERAQGKSVVVINWAGSKIEKRFSFAQVRSLVRSVRTTIPDAYIVVLSDQNTPSPSISHSYSSALPDEMYAQLLEEYDPISHARTPTTTTFDQRKINVSGRIFPLPADEFVAVDNLNQLAAYGQAADVVIGTDTFWSWWHANAKTLIVLYTIANDYYEVPGCVPVYSKALQSKSIQLGSTQMIDVDDYNRYFSGGRKVRKSLGPSKADFKMLLETVTSTFIPQQT